MGRQEDDSAVTAVVDHDTGIVELSVRGRWNRQIWLESYRMLNKCLAGHPAGLVLDLSAFEDPRAGSTSLWLTAAAQGERMEPPVPVVTCLVAPNLTAGLARMPRFASIRSARTAITSHRTMTSQVRLQLQPQPSASAGARQLVTAACEEWGMPMLLPRARLVATELVTNAVRHAGTEIDVVISHRGHLRRPISRRTTYLHLAVYDRNPTLPEPNGGRGLHIIRIATQGWGALPTREGKVVWALLREQD
ncbi:ATP-binding protein [Actinoplanes sp. NPDC049596]|uniref:ATP-binding protein n=1 Tax=unclassified Actinoplanes TaxID=2626549 RepID=UPI003420B692